MLQNTNTPSEGSNELVSVPSEKGGSVAIFQGAFAMKHLNASGLRIGTRYRLHQKSVLSGKMKRLDDFVDIAGISDDFGGIQSNNAQSEENLDGYKDRLGKNPRSITVWGKHNGSTAIGVIDYLKEFKPQEDGSVSMGRGFFWMPEENEAQDIVTGNAEMVDTILSSQ